MGVFRFLNPLTLLLNLVPTRVVAVLNINGPAVVVTVAWVKVYIQQEDSRCSK